MSGSSLPSVFGVSALRAFTSRFRSALFLLLLAIPLPLAFQKNSLPPACRSASSPNSSARSAPSTSLTVAEGKHQ